jgi:hypothetical protein
MMIPTSAFHQHDAIIGPTPTLWCGVDVPDGDAFDFATAGVGSVYYYIDTTNDVSQQFTKIKNDGADNDWSRGIGVIRQNVVLADFTDQEDATGTMNMDVQIPQHAFVLRVVLTDVIAFAGDSSSALTVGYTGDTDAFVASGGASVQAAAEVVDGGVPQAPAVLADKTILLTITEDNDFGDITTGSMTVSVYYLL